MCKSLVLLTSLRTLNGTNNDNLANSKIDPEIIFIRLSYYNNKGDLLIKFCIRIIKVSYLRDGPIKRLM